MRTMFERARGALTNIRGAAGSIPETAIIVGQPIERQSLEMSVHHASW